MIDKGERVMHITTPHIQAKRRHIDAETRLRRLSHVVAASTRVVRGCKLPRRPSARFSSYAESRRPAFSVWAVDSSCPYPSSFGSVCGVPAKAKKEKMELAGLLQRPQRRKWSLQDFCKSPKGENGACRTSANVPKGKMELAELLQMPQRGKRSLQNFCKRPKGENGACRTSANVPKEKMELAELLQTPQRGKRSLQNFCKHLLIHSYITPHT